jgi:hypothetical protein
MHEDSIDAAIFYFDLIGVTAQFLDDQVGTLRRLREFHRAVRRLPFPFGGPHTTLKTLADNVWTRINMGTENIVSDMRVLELAAGTMRAARDHGFPRFFGVITRGEHEFELQDRILVSGGDPTDLLVQHIDMTSEPHIRAALAEKWSAHLAKQDRSPVPVPAVWVGEEVMPDGEFEDQICGLHLPIFLRSERVDLAAGDGPGGRAWPFTQSRFRAITLR